MLRIFFESIHVILKSEGFFNKMMHGLTWALVSVIIMGVIAMVVHYG